MLTGNRILFSDNGVLSDASRDLNDLYAGAKVIPVVAAEDKLFLGSEAKFNHRYFQVSVVNDVASVMSVDLWTGSEWVPALDVIDGTSNSGVCLAQPGILQWTKDRNKSWAKQSKSEDVTGLTGTKIYDMYWARISFSANLKATTALSYVGHRFANDLHLGGMYPDLVRSTVLTAFKAAKVDWNEQHVVAAEEMIADLRKDKLLWSGSQVLDWEKFNIPAVHKVAEIIMRAFGDDFADRREEAKEDYLNALRASSVGIDRNEDGELQREEQRVSVGLFRA